MCLFIPNSMFLCLTLWKGKVYTDNTNTNDDSQSPLVDKSNETAIWPYFYQMDDPKICTHYHLTVCNYVQLPKPISSFVLFVSFSSILMYFQPLPSPSLMCFFYLLFFIYTYPSPTSSRTPPTIPSMTQANQNSYSNFMYTIFIHPRFYSGTNVDWHLQNRSIEA